MSAFSWLVVPDRRVQRRLMTRLRASDAPSAYANGGEALAATLLATRPEGALPEASDELADAMLGSLLVIGHDLVESDDDGLRVRFAVATVALSALRPHAARACDVEANLAVSAGLCTPRFEENGYTLAARALLGLLFEDDDVAAECVDTLLERDRTGVAGILHDWVVARRHGHGALRESQCFDHLRISLQRTPGGGAGAALLLLAAVVATKAAGLPRAHVVDWLDRMAGDVDQIGAASCSANAG